MKRVNVNRQKQVVQEFIRTLPIDREGCVLLIDGKPVLKVVPVTEAIVDPEQLKKAILRRRDESRRLNQEWEHVDQEMWDKIDKLEG